MDKYLWEVRIATATMSEGRSDQTGMVANKLFDGM